jgi:hypothetical protein
VQFPGQRRRQTPEREAEAELAHGREQDCRHHDENDDSEREADDRQHFGASTSRPRGNRPDGTPPVF